MFFRNAGITRRGNEKQRQKRFWFSLITFESFVRILRVLQKGDLEGNFVCKDLILKTKKNILDVFHLRIVWK